MKIPRTLLVSSLATKRGEVSEGLELVDVEARRSVVIEEDLYLASVPVAMQEIHVAIR